MTAERAVTWHDVECGAYAEDLPLWEELAETAGPVRTGRGAKDSGALILELGCGTGRVALHLARRGHDVWGLDKDARLVAELERRAGEAALHVSAIEADARDFDLERRFALCLAPMQLIQILGGPGARAQMLRRIADHLAPGGIAALALADVPPGEGDADPGASVPDMTEREGWIVSSIPLSLRTDDGSILVERLRQAVSPGGHMEEELSVERLDRITPAKLEEEARAAGLRSLGRRAIPPSALHVGSTVALLTAR